MTADPGSGEGAGPQEPPGGPSATPPPPPPYPPGGYGTGYGYQQPHYPAGYGPQRRLVRRTDNKTIGGVASGIADYLGIDVVLVRVGFIVLTITGGIGVPLYLLLWLFLPEATPAEIGAAPARPGSSWPADGHLERLKAFAPYLLLLIGGAILASEFSHPEIFFAVALIALGVHLFRREAAGPPPSPGPGPVVGPGAGPAASTGGTGTWVASAPPPPPAPAPAPEVPVPVGMPPASAPPGPGPAGTTTATLPLASGPGIPPPPATATAPRPRRPKERSALGWLTIAAGLVVTGIAAGLSNLHLFSLSPGGGLALFLIVLGLGLIVSAFRGRAGWLIPVGILILPVLFAASILNPEGGGRPWRGGIGTRLWQPASAAEVQPSYRLGGGQMVLDLRRVQFGSQPPPVSASLGAGHLLVLVAPKQAISVAAHVNAGQTNLLHHIESGLKVNSSLTDPPGAASPLRLDLRIGAGEIDVRSLAVGAHVPEIQGMTPEPASAVPVPVPVPAQAPAATEPNASSTTTTQG